MTPLPLQPTSPHTPTEFPNWERAFWGESNLTLEYGGGGRGTKWVVREEANVIPFQELYSVWGGINNR